MSNGNCPNQSEGTDRAGARSNDPNIGIIGKAMEFIIESSNREHSMDTGEEGLFWRCIHYGK